MNPAGANSNCSPMQSCQRGFHRIRCYGLLTSSTRTNNIARIRGLLAVPLIPIDAITASRPARGMHSGSALRWSMRRSGRRARVAGRADPADILRLNSLLMIAACAVA